MDFLEIIAKRRDGGKHSQKELEFLACGAAKGKIPDYQIAAWLMAAYLKPLNSDETANLTLAMADSGERLDLSELPKPCLDKHSTGGVGDKTSIVVLPLLAACGVTIVKMSGRGLGITGGTVDKLLSVPGFRMDLAPKELIEQAKKIGVAITGQTPSLAPADKVLYALRDVTATVDSIPLIVSSILSKKIAGGSQTIVLDVKCGSGSFQPNLDRARSLANALKDTAHRCGLTLRIAITDMDQPLGRMIGNALEVKEAIAVLQRKSRGRFRELCLQLSGLALEACGLAESRAEGYGRAQEALESRAAEHRARKWFAAQGASDSVFENDDWAVAPTIKKYILDGNEAFVSRIEARTIGQAVVDLGGGRKKKDDVVDPSVGIELHVEAGSRVKRGEALFTVHAKDSASADNAIESIRAAFEFSQKEVEPNPVVIEFV